LFVPELFIWLMSGFACFGLLCLLEEILAWLYDRRKKKMSIRLVLLFQDNAETVEWFIRRLYNVLRIQGAAKIDEVLLVDVDSHDDTPVILAQLSRNHRLFHAVSIDSECALQQAGDALVIDCRHADWTKCFKHIKMLIGAGGKGLGDRK
jgi:hypothetical protein